MAKHYEETFKKQIVALYNNGKTAMEIVKMHYPNYNYAQRKNEWSRIDDICKRKTWNNI